jgi:hypothetical protein
MEKIEILLCSYLEHIKPTRNQYKMQTANIRTENIQTTIHSMDIDFAGRRDIINYDATKPLHIHRRNRAFVWSAEMQMNCLDSILKGYYIPPIICCSRIVDGTERREVMEGGNRITTFRKILRREVKEDLTESEYHKVCSHPITMVVMRNLTNTQQREMFRRLNKNVKVTDGQLYLMSEEDSPLVKEAMAFLNDPEYPLRDRITEMFFDTVNKDNNGQKNLENAIAIISGALYGVNYITKSFTRQEEKIENQSPIDRALVVQFISTILTIFEAADKEFPLTNKTSKKAQWIVGKYIGAIIYDLHTYPNQANIMKKWQKYIVMVRKGTTRAIEALDIQGAQNINPDKLKRKSYKVDIFLAENRLLNSEELNQIRHTSASDAAENEDDDVSLDGEDSDD